MTPTIASKTLEITRFLRTWVANPGRTAAIAPSGKALARLITREVSDTTGKVIELGPGTGAFTQALIDRGVSEQGLILFELSDDFIRLLHRKFPQARIVPACASRLCWERYFDDDEKAGAAISGLPLLIMPPKKVMAILKGTFQHLRPGAALYQFTYTARCPIPRAILDRLGLKAERIGRAYRNLPPAAVYRISRSAPVADDYPSC